jgi:hypothetical protein
MHEEKSILQIPLPPPEWIEHMEREQKKKEEEKSEENPRVIILDI